MKVLVADDSAVTRQLLISSLESWDYETLEAKDGEEAWQLFQTHAVSLVLTDWIMPVVDGLELIRRIRASKHPGYCYLILLTAKSDKEDLVCAMEAGADDFLVKPCDQQELRVRLREGVRIIRLEQELAQQNRQLREAQAALVQSEKLAGLGQLAAGMAHEVNNPIAFVSNNLAVLKREIGAMSRVIESYQQARPYLTDAPQELLEELSRREEDCDFAWLSQYLPQLLKSSTQGLARVTDIVSNLRDFARLDQAPYDLLDLGQAIRSTLEMLNHAVEEKQLTVNWSIEEEPKVLCHPEKINQVIYNVILNAIQASSLGSSLDIGLSLNSGKARMEVTDHGVGMNPATLGRVFEPFFTTKPVGTGSGLGMAVSYGIVRDHGGSITIQSQLGEGTTVQVDLPLKPTVSRKLATVQC
ncbi:MAG: sensor histidine kinase [Planctomycetaceae bacterium]